MAFRIFTIPVGDDGSGCAELNRFLQQVRVLGIERQLVGRDGAGWSFCVEYAATEDRGTAGRAVRSGKAPVDWREVLDDASFQVFASLRQARKAWADEAGLPVYALFTNEQLAAIARLRPQTEADLQSIEGLGQAKVSAWGQRLLGVLAQAVQPTQPQ